MYAIIETGGKQYRVKPGDEIHVEKISADPDGQMELDRVLMYADEERLAVGTPTVAQVKVKAHIVTEGRERKVVIFRMKKRKNYRRKKGHRQPFTVLRIDEIAVEN